MIDNSQFQLKRFTRRPQPRNDNQPTAEPPGPKLILNTRIRKYVNGASVSASAPAYLSIKEVPTAGEISVLPNGEGEDVEVPANHVVGPWQSKRKYLSDHYALLREDAVTPLRNVVSEMKAEPWVLEKDSIEHSYIYEKVGSQDVSNEGLRSPLADTCWQVFIVGLTFAHSGVAAKLTFSLRRTGKKIIWEQSKRLIQGTLIAISPMQDMFKTICKVGVVAARPLSGVHSNPPEVDIFFGSPDEVEIDPQQEWVMVESSIGYFEAYRHTLLSLQKMAAEP